MEDQVLLEGKKKGLSYKEILHSHDFGIAESTLRGRYRSLTKDSAQRVRKPFWYDDDVRSSLALAHSLKLSPCTNRQTTDYAAAARGAPSSAPQLKAKSVLGVGGHVYP
jgi:hypothetical protein